MCQTADFLRDRLRGSRLTVVDMLSDVLSVLRAGRPKAGVVTWQGAWAQRFSPVPGAVGFRVVVRGDCVLVPAGAAPVRLDTGDVVLLPHGRGHVLADSPATPPAAQACDPAAPHFPDRRPRVVAEGPTTVTLCGAWELAPEGHHPLLGDLPEVIHLDPRADGRAELRATVDLLGTELTRPGLGTDAAIPALLDMLLLYALRAWFEETRSSPGTGWAALRDPAVAAALHAIHQDPAHPWTVAALATLAGLSRAPFARRFAELAGQPPMRYLTWWRMTTAARMLRESDASLNAIAVAVGYTSEFAFAVAFKRQYDIPPGKYRRSAAP